ncbi:hypothetical protein JMM81_12335 [Bacillus sp. V3B]|uniref:hypothetical protein n=1 Tax=Bacillus sp. V3B TaxID=2804915 RepID=UPI0021092BA4|nr:hypothetical protein [Bacillus sp. V3B]MCQ6275744.1 hypothetical protein [Bacillus sp. V3B]
MEFQLAIIGGIGTVFGIIISILSFNRHRDKDVKSEASESAVIRTKLDNINSGVESIRIDMKVEQKARVELSERVARVEESSKQAHKRIDEVEKKG